MQCSVRSIVQSRWISSRSIWSNVQLSQECCTVPVTSLWIKDIQVYRSYEWYELSPSSQWPSPLSPDISKSPISSQCFHARSPSGFLLYKRSAPAPGCTSWWWWRWCDWHGCHRHQCQHYTYRATTSTIQSFDDELLKVLKAGHQCHQLLEIRFGHDELLDRQQGDDALDVDEEGARRVAVLAWNMW